MKTFDYKVNDTALEVPADTELVFGKEAEQQAQMQRRAHKLVNVSGDVFRLTKPTQFKRGEVIRFVHPPEKSLLQKGRLVDPLEDLTPAADAADEITKTEAYKAGFEAGFAAANAEKPSGKGKGKGASAPVASTSLSDRKNDSGDPAAAQPPVNPAAEG